MHVTLVTTRESLLSSWRDASRPQRLAYAVGMGLIGVGLLHLVGFLLLGGPWLGPVAWRKPFAFGLSFGLTTLTLGWISTHLRLSRGAAWVLLGGLAGANTYEVAWVTIQRARGEASHFNFTTLLDGALFIAAAVAITVTVAVIVVLTLRAFTSPDTTPSMARAIRAGLLILLVSQAVGGLMISTGLAALAQGHEATTTIGQGGMLKVPHAVGMHAIQVLPALALALSFSALEEGRRLRLVGLACAGYWTLVAFSLVQTLRGRALWDFGVL